ncbi:MAG: hypothetical protein E6K80_01245 [Candidatus Eisenbacteria bacterium]|uniref:DUF4162 domain-containing protein n=1 Tax=Eiseniibacteriota bacterium TaxID=2212470 RepID=A0A538UAT0_UNCEI|nr:MAG: hypothetical protein E6K80_01245 [Candidatus Eisenbacteria bacterium]
MRVRSLAGALERVGRDTLVALARRANADIVDLAPPQARFAVADDEGAARLIEVLVGGGIPIVEAAPDESRLERLFLGGAAEPPTAPGSAAPSGPSA